MSVQKTKTATPVTTASVIETGVAAMADGKLSTKERTALKASFGTLTGGDRQAALDGLRAQAPKAAQLVAAKTGEVTLDEFKARVATDLKVGRPNVRGGNEIYRSGLSHDTARAYRRLPEGDKPAAMQSLIASGISEKAAKAYLEPPPPRQNLGFPSQFVAFNQS